MSGPLVPEDLPKEEPIVPLEWIVKLSKDTLGAMTFDESGLREMSRAVENFTRNLIISASDNGKQEVVYDNIAEVIETTNNEILKMFFPKRIRLGDVPELEEMLERDRKQQEAAANKKTKQVKQATRKAAGMLAQSSRVWEQEGTSSSQNSAIVESEPPSTSEMINP